MLEHVRVLGTSVLGLVLLLGCSPADPPEVGSPTPRVNFTLETHCGIDDLNLDGKWYERVGGRLDDRSGNPPAGWNNPFQVGRLEQAGDRLVFTDAAGHREVFRPRPSATGPKAPCA